MEWVMLFAASWVLFAVLADLSSLKVNIWCGLLAVFMQLYIDYQAIGHKLYSVEKPVVQMLGSSVFFTFGPVLVMGTLLAQYHPYKRWIAAVHVLAVSILYSMQELWLVGRNAVLYKDWSFGESIMINVAVIAVLSWFSIVFLGKRADNEI